MGAAFLRVLLVVILVAFAAAIPRPRASLRGPFVKTCSSWSTPYSISVAVSGGVAVVRNPEGCGTSAPQPTTPGALASSVTVPGISLLDACSGRFKETVPVALNASTCPADEAPTCVGGIYGGSIGGRQVVTGVGSCGLAGAHRLVFSSPMAHTQGFGSGRWTMSLPHGQAGYSALDGGRVFTVPAAGTEGTLVVVGGKGDLVGMHAATGTTYWDGVYVPGDDMAYHCHLDASVLVSGLAQAEELGGTASGTSLFMGCSTPSGSSTGPTLPPVALTAVNATSGRVAWFTDLQEEVSGSHRMTPGASVLLAALGAEETELLASVQGGGLASVLVLVSTESGAVLHHHELPRGVVLTAGVALANRTWAFTASVNATTSCAFQWRPSGAQPPTQVQGSCGPSSAVSLVSLPLAAGFGSGGALACLASKTQDLNCVRLSWPYDRIVSRTSFSAIGGGAVVTACTQHGVLVRSDSGTHHMPWSALS